MFKNKKRSFSKKVVSLVMLVASTIFFPGCFHDAKAPDEKIDLEVWGVFDESDAYSELFDAYTKVSPFVGSIRYKKFAVNEYRDELIEAFASGNGPDIFMVNNSWMPDFENKLAAAPQAIFSQKDFLDSFVDVAAFDLLNGNGNVLAAPLSVDSLALYYNKDIFNANGISNPPKNWDEFVNAVQRTTKTNELGEIVQFGTAMGTVGNINRATDIIDLLMLQNGLDLPKRGDRQINFSRIRQVEGQSVAGGLNALEFFMSFSNPRSTVYSWSSDESVHYSLDEFYEGDLATMLNFSWQYETIRSKNSKLNFAVAPIPQLNANNPVNMANYWAFAVSESKRNPKEGSAITNEIRINEAWQFLRFLTMKNNGTFNVLNHFTGETLAYPVSIDPAKVYLEKTRKPAARRDLIETQKSDPFLSPFAQGNLIAKSWFRFEPQSVEAIWAEVVRSINRGEITISQAISIATSRINSLYDKNYE